VSDVAVELDGLRITIAEVEVLSTLTASAYDSADWSDADPAIVDQIATLLGLIAKSASAALAAFHRLHGAVADAQPAPAGEQWTTATALRGETSDLAGSGHTAP
jgi:hypothetical protein